MRVHRKKTFFVVGVVGSVVGSVVGVVGSKKKNLLHLIPYIIQIYLELQQVVGKKALNYPKNTKKAKSYIIMILLLYEKRKNIKKNRKGI